MAQTKVKLIADGVIVQGNLHASHGITTADIGENASYLYYTDARVSNYLSTNGYDTATNIIASITDSAPSTLDTLNELAAALGDDANFSTTVTNSIATKLPLAGGTLTGNLNTKNILFSTSALPAANTPSINLRDTNNEIYFQSGSAHVFNFIRYDNRNSMMNLESTGISVTGGGTFSGNISGARGLFNSGSTNVVATFTSTDGIATLQCADPTGNVEFGASGNNFVVQPAGGVAQLTVGSSTSTFAGDVMPVAENAHNIGSAAVRWEDLYVDDGFIRDAYIDEYIYHNGDTDTYIRFTSDTMNFRTAGDDAITIDSNRRVGIGTTSPTSKLHLRDPGTNSDVGIKIGNDSRDWNLKVMGSVSDSLQFFTHDNSNVMTILPSGNVGIGNANPQTNLTIGSAQGNSLEFTYDSTNGYRNIISNHWDSSTDTRMDFNIGRTGNVAPVPVMSVGYGGNVGIGTTTPSAKLTIDNGSASGGSLLKSSSSSYTAHFIGNTGTGSAGIYMDAMDGDFIGSNYGFIGQNNAGYMEYNVSPSSPLPYHYFAQNIGIGTTSPSRELDIQASSGWAEIALRGNTGGGGSLEFWTNTTKRAEIFADTEDIVFRNTASNTERMRITSAGVIEVRNGGTVGGELKLTGADNDFTINGQRGQVVYEIAGTQTYVMDSQQFYPSADNARNIGTASNRFSVVYSANGVSTSDETLKENIEECDLGINFINSLKPKSYNLKNLKEDNDAYGKKRYGLIAQDLLQTELKDSVFGKKDGEYGLSYNDLIAPMIKAIQELKAEVELLKTQINN